MLDSFEFDWLELDSLELDKIDELVSLGTEESLNEEDVSIFIDEEKVALECP